MIKKHVVAEIFGFKKLIKTFVSEHVTVYEFIFMVKMQNSLMSECTCVYKIQTVVDVRLMMEVTQPGPLPTPVLCKKTQKAHFLSATLPMDCVVSPTCNDSVKQ